MPDESLMQGDVIRQHPQAKGSNPTPYKSVVAMTNEEIIASAGTTMDPLRGIATNEDRLPAHMRSILEDQEQGRREGRKPRVTPTTIPRLTGTVDPAASAFAIGDKVYHRGRHMEGKVTDVSVKSGIKVKFAKGEAWMNPKNLVKL